MATQVKFKSKIWQGATLLINDLSEFESGGSPTYSLAITLPDGSVLTLADGAFPDSNEIWDTIFTTLDSDYLEQDLIQSDWTEIIPTDTETGYYVTAEDVADVIDDGDATYVDSDGETADWSYTEFPAGVYKLVLTVTVTGTGAGTYTFTRYIVNMYTIEQDIYEYIEDYLEAHVDETIPKHQVDALRDMALKLQMIDFAVRLDLEAGNYTAANEKIAAIEDICDTGVYTFK
jgi:hypothetical protein